MRLVKWVLFSLLLFLASPPGWAFRECNASGSVVAGKWPDPDNTSNFGTQKWEFRWEVNEEGLEVQDVRYTSNLSQPKKMVMKRGSLPFLPVQYAGAHFYNDNLTLENLNTDQPFCCFHVPTTLCHIPDRSGPCLPYEAPSVDTSTCPGGSVPCDGVCIGTQIDTTPPLEDGTGEVVSGASDADVVLSAAFKLGGYVFVQRWRFTDDGRILPSVRLGGVHQCALHTHQVYWRFNFQLAEDSQTKSEVVQQCDSGSCPDTGSTGWSANLDCDCGQRPFLGTIWRVGDNNLAGRMMIIASNPAEGVAAEFCANAVSCPGGVSGCVNTHDFCALAASEPRETFASNACNDNISAAESHANCGSLATGTDATFWYFGHVDNHNPNTYLPSCDPAIGQPGVGPTIRLIGTGW